MLLQAFQAFYPEIAYKECRCVVLPEDGPGIPAGKYAFVEYYCGNKHCDCQRVMLRVVDEATEVTLAWISYGWAANEKMPGPFLDPLHRQSRHAEELLDLVEGHLA